MTGVQGNGLDPRYFRGIRAGLDAALARAEEQRYDPAADRIVIFSDHHRGVGDPADDFRRGERAYAAALGFYLEAGYRLFLLGDVEELWEERPGPVVERYRDVLALEREFARGGGLDRFYGNHDDLWAHGDEVAEHLGAGITVRGGLRLHVARPGAPDGILFFVHGHQGTRESARWRPLSRLFVRHVWRPIQRRTGFSATSPSRDYALRAKHDRAMYEWARTRRDPLVLIAGHTHRPVFARSTPDPPPTRPVADLERALADAVGDRGACAALRAELEYARTAHRRPDEVLAVSPPCYFNTGCCSFPDGDITGLELADGEIRLVRWPGNLREICRPGATVETQKRVLATETLEHVFGAVCGPGGPEPGAIEHEIRPA